MKAKAFHISVQGASHIKHGKECQDASASYSDEHCTIAIVCDGHGGNDYIRSARGSQYASSIALENIKEFIRCVDQDKLDADSGKMLKQLKASIISAWNEAVLGDFSQNPLTDGELTLLSAKARKNYLEGTHVQSLYGTTMIAVVLVDDSYWFGLHIGDGKCVAVNAEGEFRQPIPWDSKCFLNATTSMCDSAALSNIRHFYSRKLPVAVFVGSDGIDDCFRNNEQLNNLYKTVLYSFTTNDFDTAVKEFGDYLPRLSTRGSGDDVSVAAILDLDAIAGLQCIKDYDTEKEKARVEEAARQETLRSEEEKLRVERERDEQLKQQQKEREEHRRQLLREQEARQREQEARRREQERKRRAMNYCAYCGAPYAPGAKFCSNCGQPYPPPHPMTQVKQYKQPISENSTEAPPAVIPFSPAPAMNETQGAQPHAARRELQSPMTDRLSVDEPDIPQRDTYSEDQPAATPQATTPEDQPAAAPQEDATEQDISADYAAIPVPQEPIWYDPLEDVPIEDASTEDASIEDVPVEDTHDDDASVEEVPAEDTPVENVPDDDEIQEESSTEDEPSPMPQDALTDTAAPVEASPSEEAGEDTPHL